MEAIESRTMAALTGRRDRGHHGDALNKGIGNRSNIVATLRSKLKLNRIAIPGTLREAAATGSDAHVPPMLLKPFMMPRLEAEASAALRPLPAPPEYEVLWMEIRGIIESGKRNHLGIDQ